MAWPAARPCAISALTSFGRQLPPKPQPACRNAVIGGSPSCIAAAEVLTQVHASHYFDGVDAANAAPRFASSFENEISVASKRVATRT